MMIAKKQNSFKKKAPPPPVPKKPSILENTSAKSSIQSKTSLFEAKPQSKAGQSYNEALNKKLLTPLSFTEKLKKVIANNDDKKSPGILTSKLKSESNITINSDEKLIKPSKPNKVTISDELESILSIRNRQSHDNEDTDLLSHSENPRSEKTYSLTEVSNITGTWKTEEQLNDDTLDLTLSDGFDTSVNLDTDKNTGLNMNDDVFDFPAVLPPPPPMEEFSDDDGDFSLSVQYQPDSARSGFDEGLSSGQTSEADFIIPPPPPPDLGDASDDDGFLKPPSLFNSEMVDFDDDNDDSETFDFGGLDSDDDLPLPCFDDDKVDVKHQEESKEKKENSDISSSKNLVQSIIDTSKSNIPISVVENSSGFEVETRNNSEPSKSSEQLNSMSNVTKSQHNSTSSLDSLRNRSITKDPTSRNQRFLDVDLSVKNRSNSYSKVNNGDVSIPNANIQKQEPNKPIIKQNTIPTLCLDELKNKMDTGKVILKEKQRDFGPKKEEINSPLSDRNSTVSRKPFDVSDFGITSGGEFDSGLSTAPSQEVSDTEKVNSTRGNSKTTLYKGFSSETLNTVIDNNQSRENSVSMKRKVLRKTSNASRTWSSYSCSESETDDEKGESQLNLREMLMKHMKSSFDSENDDDDDDDDDGKCEINLQNNYSKNLTKPLEDQESSAESEIETRLNDLDVVDWTKSDVGDWLELIGLPHLKHVFAVKNIDGASLSNIDMKLLEEMNIDNKEDQEAILSEIYALQNPADGDLELTMLDALDKASGTEREKMLSLVKALQVPSQSDYIENYINSPQTESPRELSPEISPREGGNDRMIKMHQAPELYGENPTGGDDDVEDDDEKYGNKKVKNSSKEELMARLVADVYDPTEDDRHDDDVRFCPTTYDVPQEKLGHGKKAKGTSQGVDVKNQDNLPATPEPEKKKRKRKGFFASLRRKKKNKEVIPEATINKLSQSNPMGMVDVSYSPQNSPQDNTIIHLLVSLNTTSKEVCRMCLEHLGLSEDFNCYYIVISRKDRKVQNIGLTATECPLMFQCKWPDPNTYGFELKYKYDGHVIINNEDTRQEEMLSVKLGISNTTTAKDIIPILVKKFKEKEEEKYFYLKQAEKDDRIPGDAPLLNLPLQGYKFHVFQLINGSSKPSSKERAVSFREVKKMETKISLLERQVERFISQIEGYKRNEIQLKTDKDILNGEISRMGDELKTKTQTITKLQDELTSAKKTSSANPARATSPIPFNNTDDMRTMQKQISELTSEIDNQKYQIERYEANLKSYKEFKTKLEKECQDWEDKYQRIEKNNQDLKEQNDNLRNSQKNKTTDNNEQLKKLYSENKDYLKQMRLLEEKLSDVEYKLSQQTIEHESETNEVMELRSRTETLEHQLIDKDSKFLEYDYKLQKKDRDIRDLEDQLEDERRKLKKEIDSRNNSERKNEDIYMKLENLKTQVTDKEKTIQNLKNQLNKQEKKLTKQKSVVEVERTQNENELNNLRQTHQQDINLFENKLESLQKLLVEKDLMRKQREFDFAKEREDLLSTVKDVERKLTSKDVIIERLEEKIAKSDLNVSSTLENQHESLKQKDESIRQLEMEIMKQESVRKETNQQIEHASKVRELSNTIRSKETITTKLETRLRKLENIKKKIQKNMINTSLIKIVNVEVQSNKENTKKYEKYLSDKDRLIQNVNDERDREIKDLKIRLRTCEDQLNEKENKHRDALRKVNEHKEKGTSQDVDVKNQNSYETRLKKREKEFKQQKFLLEKVLELVNLKAPSLLRHIQESLDDDQPIGTTKHKTIKSPRTVSSAIDDEWC